MPDSILIIDDEPRITFALMTRLEHEGYTVFHAINGLAGVEASALHRPDAIVLDIRMPDIDGFETCRRIRRLPDLGSVPIVFLSASASEETRLHAFEAGGNAFIPKPYEAAEVLNTVKRELHNAKSEEDVDLESSAA